MSFAEDRLAKYLLSYLFRHLLSWVCRGEGGGYGCFLWTILLKLRVDLLFNFTIPFYINFTLHYCTLLSNLLSCLAHHRMCWPDTSDDSCIYEEIFLWIFFTMIYACMAYVKDVLSKKGLVIFVVYVRAYFYFGFILLGDIMFM